MQRNVTHAPVESVWPDDVLDVTHAADTVVDVEAVAMRWEGRAWGDGWSRRSGLHWWLCGRCSLAAAQTDLLTCIVSVLQNEQICVEHLNRVRSYIGDIVHHAHQLTSYD